MRNVLASLSLGILIAALFVLTAVAQRRNRRNTRQQASSSREPQAPSVHEPAIAEAMGGVRWGWTKEQVLDHFREQTRERYRPEIAKARDAITEDRLRADMGNELRRITESYVCFQGRRNAWDASFIRYEFTYGNRECMLVREDAEAQDFYFFIGDRLWKRYRAMREDGASARRFEGFVGALQERFGRARRVEGALVEGEQARTWLEWEGQETRVRAVDQSRTYGFFALIFEDRATVAQLTSLRTAQPRVAPQRNHALVDAVTQPADSAVDPDSNPDIVDRITGKIRNTPPVPAR